MKLLIPVIDTYPGGKIETEKNKNKLYIYRNIQDYFSIQFPLVLKEGESWSSELIINCTKLIQHENEYIFEFDESEYFKIEETDTYYYALLFPNKKYEPGEVYISQKYKNHVTVLEKIEFTGLDISRCRFIDKMYFVKIDLSIDEPIRCFLSSKEETYLDEYIEFYKNPYLHLAYGRTGIKLNEDYISLSEL